MLNFIQLKLLSLAIAAIPVGLLAALLLQGVKRMSTTVDGWDPIFKKGALLVIAMVVTAIGTALHVPLVCQPDVNCLATLDAAKLEKTITAILALIPALLAHKAKKALEGPTV